MIAAWVSWLDRTKMVVYHLFSLTIRIIECLLIMIDMTFGGGEIEEINFLSHTQATSQCT